ncbi:MAG: hypothetical protein QXL94_04770 [Candidatus Parvarchaeum sp.]
MYIMQNKKQTSNKELWLNPNAKRPATTGLNNAVYRSVAESILSGNDRLGINSIAKNLHISPNTVDIAIKALENVGAAKISNRSFEITNLEKMLMYWAAVRKLNKSIAYSTFVGTGVLNIEKMMPGEVAFTGCSGYTMLFGNDVADYGEVYVYATNAALEEIKKRFPQKNLSAVSNYADLYILRPDKPLELSMKTGIVKSTVPKSQLYVDLWNIKGWQASMFFAKAKEHIFSEVNNTHNIEGAQR